MLGGTHTFHRRQYLVADRAILSAQIEEGHRVEALPAQARWPLFSTGMRIHESSDFNIRWLLIAATAEEGHLVLKRSAKQQWSEAVHPNESRQSLGDILKDFGVPSSGASVRPVRFRSNGDEGQPQAGRVPEGSFSPARRSRAKRPACGDRKSTRLNSSHVANSYAVF